MDTNSSANQPFFGAIKSVSRVQTVNIGTYCFEEKSLDCIVLPTTKVEQRTTFWGETSYFTQLDRKPRL